MPLFFSPESDTPRAAVLPLSSLFSDVQLCVFLFPDGAMLLLLLLPPPLRSPLFPLFPSQTLNACTYRACHGSSEMWTTCSLKGAGAKLSHLHSPPPAHSTSTIHSAGLISLSRLLLQVLLAHGVRRGERLQQCGASLHRCMRRVVKKFKKKRKNQACMNHLSAVFKQACVV